MKGKYGILYSISGIGEILLKTGANKGYVPHMGGNKEFAHYSSMLLMSQGNVCVVFPSNSMRPMSFV